MCTNNYSNKERFDKVITKNKMVQFFLPHRVSISSNGFNSKHPTLLLDPTGISFVLIFVLVLEHDHCRRFVNPLTGWLQLRSNVMY